MLFPAGVVVLTLVAVELCLVRGLELVLERPRKIRPRSRPRCPRENFDRNVVRVVQFNVE